MGKTLIIEFPRHENNDTDKKMFEFYPPHNKTKTIMKVLL